MRKHISLASMMSVLLSLLGLLLAPTITHAVVDIPALTWTVRSDWVDVTTQGADGSDGDDDTTAIQAALNLLTEGVGGYKAVYFPAGTYYISETLTLTKTMGNMLVGCGRNTRLVWTGATGGIMFHSNGASYHRYIGLVWDGNNLASVGVDHRAETGTYYETHIQHRHEHFENFIEPDPTDSNPTTNQAAGIRIGHNQQIASAEIIYQNCYFDHNTTGVSLLQANDYNNTFAGCEFQDNAYGIYCYVGNWYVRGCHFERSNVCDVRQLNAMSFSLRRCTSTGSRQFFYQSGSTWMTPICIQDCWIDDWTETANGAIQLGVAGPDTIFDCVFTNPPNTNPPINLCNNSYCRQPVITSHNVSTDTSSVINTHPYATVTDIPTAMRAVDGCMTSASQSFLQDTVPAEGTVYDAKRDFDAVGDGVADDTTALRNCINAARTAGNGAVAYIPTGTYKITGTLYIYGSTNYSVQGSGFRTYISWGGGTTGNMIKVQDNPQVRIGQLRLIAPSDDTDSTYDAVSRISLDSTTGSTAFVVIDGVHTVASYTPHTRFVNGLKMNGLPEGALVVLEMFRGSVDILNCSRAQVLGNFHTGKLRVRGATYGKTGFTGWNFFGGGHNDYDLWVRDNQDVVITDFYSENTDHIAYILGDSCTVTGRVTVQAIKQHLSADATYITINNYTGQIFWGNGGFFDYYTPYSIPIAHSGTRAVDLLFIGVGFRGAQPTFTLGSGATKYLLGNLWRNPDQSVPANYGIITDDPNPFTDAAKQKVAYALDHLEELGWLDMINY
ncbi:MAG: glycosyl hydrolase family 28-related protein [Armatimonadota bacterium]